MLYYIQQRKEKSTRWLMENCNKPVLNWDGLLQLAPRESQKMYSLWNASKKRNIQENWTKLIEKKMLHYDGIFFNILEFLLKNTSGEEVRNMKDNKSKRSPSQLTKNWENQWQTDGSVKRSVNSIMLFTNLIKLLTKIKFISKLTLR